MSSCQCLVEVPEAGLGRRHTARSAGPTVALRQIDALLEYPGFRSPLSSLDVRTTLICGELDARTLRQCIGAWLRK